MCSQKRRTDDHLSLVAGISRLQRRELEAHDIATLATLGVMPLPLVFKPKRGAAATYERVREQDLKQNAIVMAWFAWQAATTAERIPRP